MCISYFIKSRLIYLDNRSCLVILITSFSNLAEVRVCLVQPENSLLPARISAVKAGETFPDFSRPTAYGINFPFLTRPGTTFCRN